MRLAPAFLALAACRSAAAPQGPSGSSPPYLALFERGRTWSLPSVEVTGKKEGESWVTTKTERGTARCSVADVKQVGDANVSRISCAAPHAGLLVVGTWVAMPAGLYHPLLPIDDADELALLGEDDLLIAARPADRQHGHALGGAEDTIEAFSFKRSWCVRQTTAAETDRRGYTLCFGDGGVTGGGEIVITGAEFHRVQFGAFPSDPDDPTTAPD